MKNLYFLGLIFLCLSSNSLYSSQVDSLRLIWENEELSDSLRFNALEEYDELYSLVSPDSVLVVLDYYHDLAITKGADRQLYRSFLRKGNIFRLQDRIDEARTHYYEAQLVAKKINNARLEAIIIGNLGNLHLHQGEYLESIKKYNKAKKIFVTEGDKDGEARMLNATGAINSRIGNHDIALVHYEEALSIYSLLKGDEYNAGLGTTTILMNIGLIHFKNDLFIKAESSFIEALKRLKTDNYKYYIAGCYSMLAQIYLSLNQVENSLLFANKNFDINKELDTQRGILEAKIILAKINYQKNKSQAIEQLENILESVFQAQSLESKMEVSELLYKGYKFQNRLDLSLKMYEFFNLYNDSIKAKTDSYAIARETVKNEYKEILFEAKLNSEREKNKLRLNQVKKITSIIFISIVLVLLLIYFIALNNKKNNRRRDALLEQIKFLKDNKVAAILDSNKLDLSKEKIDNHLDRVLNETDWNVLLILLDNPMVLNKEIAEKSNMSIDGIGSSLRRMYEYFEINETKYKKVSLIHKAVNISERI